MPLPSNFSSAPKEEIHHHFRNVCIEFRKTVSSSKNIDKLEEQMDRFNNVSREITWPRTQSDVYHKEEGDKAIQKVMSEYQRYAKNLKGNSNSADSKDLIKALNDLEQLVRRS